MPSSSETQASGGGVSTAGIGTIRAALPDFAEDIRRNLELVLEEAESTLEPTQRWGVAVASAVAARRPSLLAAVLADARERVPEEVVQDAMAAAAIMAMNVVYYGFLHMVHKEAYAARLPNLHMHRMARPATSRRDSELFSLAAAAVHGCHPCVVGHEQALTEGEEGLSTEQVHDAIRIAATLHAAAVSLDAADAIQTRHPAS